MHEFRVSDGKVASPQIKMSDAEYAQINMDGITIENFSPITGGHACANVSFNITNKNEEEFNAEITPLLQDICHHDPHSVALFNSERKLCLQGEVNMRKPDFHLKHCIYNEEAEPHHKLQHNYLYGGISDLRFSKEILCIFEGKIVPLDNTAVASIISYMACLIRSGNNNPRGLLYNQQEWIFYKYETSLLSRVVKGNWTDIGCKDFLIQQIEEAKSELIPSSLTEAVMKLCTCLNVQPYSHTPLLGIGRDGYAFRVNRDESQAVYAMKVVMRQGIGNEFAVLQGAFALAPELVVTPQGGFEETTITSGIAGAYLMKEVGSRASKRLIKQIVISLVALHQASLTHGDPRVDNIILVNGSLKWIDFRQCGSGIQFNEQSKINDLKILIKSAYLSAMKENDIYQAFGKVEIVNLFNAYGSMPTVENAMKVIKDLIMHSAVILHQAY